MRCVVVQRFQQQRAVHNKATASAGVPCGNLRSKWLKKRGAKMTFTVRSHVQDLWHLTRTGSVSAVIIATVYSDSERREGNIFVSGRHKQGRETTIWMESHKGEIKINRDARGYISL